MNLYTDRNHFLLMDRIEILQEMIEEKPNDPFNFYALAIEFTKLEKHDQALEKFQFLTSQFPEYVATYYHYAQTLEKVNQQQKALEIYNLGMKVAQDSGDQHALSELKNAKLNLEIDMDL